MVFLYKECILSISLSICKILFLFSIHFLLLVSLLLFLNKLLRLTKVDISDNDELLAYIKTDEVLEQLYNLCKGITDGFILITNWHDYNIQGSLKSAFEYCNKMNYSLDKMPVFICYNKNHVCNGLWSSNTINFTTVNYFVDLPDLDTRIMTTDKTFVKMCKKLFGGNNKED